MNGKTILVIFLTSLLLIINFIYPSESSRLAAQSLDATWHGSTSQVDCNGPIDNNNKHWYESDFNDQSWPQISLPIVNDIPSPGDRYYRHDFTPTQSGKYYIALDSDDGVEVYINGQSIGQWGGTCHEEGCIGVVPYYCAKIEPFPDLDITQHILIGQRNVIAVHVTNHALHGDNWSYFDFRVFIEKAWPDLSKLQQNYNSKKGSNEAAFVHQFLCIATKSCDNYIQQGNIGWASEFIKYLFDFMIESDGLTESVRQTCPRWLSNDACFRLAGWSQHSMELSSGFMSYCWIHRPDIDYVRWDSDHQKFLDNAVKACFDEIAGQGELSTKYAEELKQDIPTSAIILREAIQSVCSAVSVLPNNDLSKSNLSINEFPILPLPPSDDSLYGSSLNEGNTLQVSGGKLVHVSVGATLTISVTKQNSDGTITDLTASPNNTYYLTMDKSFAEINTKGTLSIIRTSSPITSIVPVLYVVVQNGIDMGIGQFAVTDKDTDKDLIVDSYEKMVGLNPNAQNNLTSDQDFDNIPDLVETLIRTNPLKFDSDGDTFGDNYELNHSSDLLDPLCIPTSGCVSRVYLPMIRNK